MLGKELDKQLFEEDFVFHASAKAKYNYKVVSLTRSNHAEISVLDKVSWILKLVPFMDHD